MRLVLILVAFFILPCTGICEALNWKQYHDGIRLAKKENKSIFLYFRTDWCGYCEQMEQITFKDDSVVLFLNKHFVSIKVDGDREGYIAKAYKAMGYPDNRFLNEKAQEVYRLPGFLDPVTFFFFLEYIQSGSYKSMDPMQYYKSR